MAGVNHPNPLADMFRRAAENSLQAIEQKKVQQLADWTFEQLNTLGTETRVILPETASLHEQVQAALAAMHGSKVKSVVPDQMRMRKMVFFEDGRSIVLDGEEMIDMGWDLKPDPKVRDLHLEE